MKITGEKLKTEELDSKSEKNLGLIDYDYYYMPWTDKVFYTFIASVVIFSIGYVFYRSFIISLLFSSIGLFYPGIKIKTIIKKRKGKLNLQFKDLLYSLASSMSAGKSVERAFFDAEKDLQVLYPDPETSINREIKYIIRKLDMNQTIEGALANLAKRAHLEDLDDFVDVFQTCKRAGGNLIEVIANTSKIINNKIEIKEEINNMIAAKKFEQKVLTIMPIFMLLLLSISASDYISPIFTTLVGKFIMTITIVLLLTAYFISKKIMDIKV
jgi:tight adherence protein B